MRKLIFTLGIVYCLFAFQAKAQSTNPWGGTHLFNIGFFNEDKGVIIGGQTTNAFITSNGGSCWSAVEAFPNTMIRGLKVDRGTGRAWAVGQWATIRYTTNYGSSWTVADVDCNNPGQLHFMSVDVRNDVGLAVAEGGKIYRMPPPVAIPTINSTDDIFIRTSSKDEWCVENAGNLQNIRVFDLSGKKMGESNTSTVNVSVLSKGIYIVRVQTAEGITVKKIIKG